MEQEKKSWKSWDKLAIHIINLFIIAIIALTIRSVLWHQDGVRPCKTGKSRIDLSESIYPGIFADLTKPEIDSVKSFLSSRKELALKFGKAATLDSNMIITMELLRPNKKRASRYLDGKRKKKPLRWARVLISFGGMTLAVLKEFKVGPLPQPMSYSVLKLNGKDRVIPYQFMPLIDPEFMKIEEIVFNEFESKARNFLIDSFGATFRDCGKFCLNWFPVPVPGWAYKKISRKIISRIIYKHEGTPVNLYVMTNVDMKNLTDYKIISIQYNNQIFDNVDELVTAYKSKALKMIRTKYPGANGSDDFPNTASLGSRSFPKTNARPPKEYLPDGVRYEIIHNRVSYMLWSFDYRVSTLTGLQLYDIRFNNQRIVYELSLQEIAVYYSGHTTASRFSDYIDSIGFIGTSSRRLLPGMDCPEHATFIPSRHYMLSSENSFVMQNAICVFEHSNALPLRRHGMFPPTRTYSGVMDYVLVMRAIILFGNYDYIVDYMFHADGSIEVRLTSTGMIMGEPYTGIDSRYGFMLYNGTIGSLHHHIFHFKADLDIKGTNNRFETLDFSEELVKLDHWHSGQTKRYSQMKMKRELKTSELKAAYSFDFNKPKYLIFHNNEIKSKHGAPAAYRLINNAMSKQLITADMNNEDRVSWARYQVAVTKFRNDEPESSSIYSMFDVRDPVIKFQDLLDDDESIVDEDLVAWVTIGLHHLPHSEDLPQTSTVSTKLLFILQPYNYFDVEPSLGSRDSWRIDEDNTVRDYLHGSSEKCVPPEENRSDIVARIYKPDNTTAQDL